MELARRQMDERKRHIGRRARSGCRRRQVRTPWYGGARTLSGVAGRPRRLCDTVRLLLGRADLRAARRRQRRLLDGLVRRRWLGRGGGPDVFLLSSASRRSSQGFVRRPEAARFVIGQQPRPRLTAGRRRYPNGLARAIATLFRQFGQLRGLSTMLPVGQRSEEQNGGGGQHGAIAA